MTRGEATILRAYLTAISLLVQRNQPDAIPIVVETITRWIRERSEEPFSERPGVDAARPQSE